MPVETGPYASALSATPAATSSRLRVLIVVSVSADGSGSSDVSAHELIAKTVLIKALSAEHQLPCLSVSAGLPCLSTAVAVPVVRRRNFSPAEAERLGRSVLGAYGRQPEGYNEAERSELDRLADITTTSPSELPTSIHEALDVLHCAGTNSPAAPSGEVPIKPTSKCGPWLVPGLDTGPTLGSATSCAARGARP